MTTEEAATRRRFCESCGREFDLAPHQRVASRLRKCPSCGMYACRECRPGDGPCRVCLAASAGSVPVPAHEPQEPSPSLPRPTLVTGVRAARPADGYVRPTGAWIARPAGVAAPTPEQLIGDDDDLLALEPAHAGRRGGVAWTLLGVIGAIVLGTATALAGFGALGVGPAAALIAGRPTGDVAGATGRPSPMPTPAPASQAVTPTPLPSASGDGPVVVEAAFTRAWRIGSRTRGVVLTVLRNDSGEAMEVDATTTTYRIARAGGAGAALEGTFATIVPAQVPAGGRAYGVAPLPDGAPHPRELGRVAVDPARGDPSAPPTALEVRNLVWSVDKDGQPHAEGLVTNTTSGRVDGASVAVVFLDRAGRPVAVHVGEAAGPVDPGVSAPFASGTPRTAPVSPDTVADVIAFAYESPPG